MTDPNDTNGPPASGASPVPHPLRVTALPAAVAGVALLMTAGESVLVASGAWSIINASGPGWDRVATPLKLVVVWGVASVVLRLAAGATALAYAAAVRRAYHPETYHGPQVHSRLNRFWWVWLASLAGTAAFGLLLLREQMEAS